MNSSSALQPKQVIWLPRPQIKLVWFNFRFGLLLQPYIKGDIFHYTAKPQASRQRWPTPSIGRHHGSIMAFTRYCWKSSKVGGGVGAIGGLVIHRATKPRTVQPTHLACLDSCKPSCDNILAGLAAQEITWDLCRVLGFHFTCQLMSLTSSSLSFSRYANKWNHLVEWRPAYSCITGSIPIFSLVRILIQSEHLLLSHHLLPFFLLLLKVSSCVLVY